MFSIWHQTYNSFPYGMIFPLVCTTGAAMEKGMT